MKKRVVLRIDRHCGKSKRYESITDAANYVGGQESHISECMRNVGHRKTHKGYEW